MIFFRIQQKIIDEDFLLSILDRVLFNKFFCCLLLGNLEIIVFILYSG